MSIAHEIALQIDLAAASIAFIALMFSVWSWTNQRRLALEDLRTRRDNDVIAWTNATIDVICRAELLLNSSSHRHREVKEFVSAPSRTRRMARNSSRFHCAEARTGP